MPYTLSKRGGASPGGSTSCRHRTVTVRRMRVGLQTLQGIVGCSHQNPTVGIVREEEGTADVGHPEAEGTAGAGLRIEERRSLTAAAAASTSPVSRVRRAVPGTAQDLASTTADVGQSLTVQEGEGTTGAAILRRQRRVVEGTGCFAGRHVLGVGLAEETDTTRSRLNDRRCRHPRTQAGCRWVPVRYNHRYRRSRRLNSSSRSSDPAAVAMC
jgi:hypothetical protein